MRRFSTGTSMRRALSKKTVPPMRMCPASGRVRPAMALMTDVLPEPERPNRAVTPRSSAVKAMSSVKAPSVWRIERSSMVGHVCPISRRTRCARNSDSISAIRATPKEMAASRAATASPPGSWVAA